VPDPRARDHRSTGPRRALTEKLERGPEINWDVNPAAHDLAPANGWTHPFLLYQCRFGDQEYRYSLLNVDTDRARIVQEIDLSRPGR